MLLHSDALYDALRISDQDRSLQAARRFALQEALRERRRRDRTVAGRRPTRWFRLRRIA